MKQLQPPVLSPPQHIYFTTQGIQSFPFLMLERQGAENPDLKLNCHLWPSVAHQLVLTTNYTMGREGFPSQPRPVLQRTGSKVFFRE